MAFDRLKKRANNEDFTPIQQSVGLGSVAQTAESDSDAVSGSGSAQRSRDQFSTRDYLTKNTQELDDSQVRQPMQGYEEQARETGSQLRETESKNFGQAMAAAKKPESSNAQAKFIADERGRAASVDLSAFDKAMADLAGARQAAESYRVGSDNVSHFDTSEQANLLGTAEGRRQMLQRQFAPQASRYTQGMGVLDSALTERTPVDTRGLASDVRGVYDQVESERTGLGLLRDENVQAQQARLKELMQADDDVRAARANAQQELFNRQRQFDDAEQARIQKEQADKEAEDNRIRQEREDTETRQRQATEDAEAAQRQAETNRQAVQNIQIQNDRLKEAQRSTKEVYDRALQAHINAGGSTRTFTHPSAAALTEINRQIANNLEMIRRLSPNNIMGVTR